MKLRRIAANLILVAVAALALRAWHEIRQGFIARAKPFSIELEKVKSLS